MRNDNRQVDELREIKITPNYNLYAEGSVLIELGNTRVICTASVNEKLPPFLRGEKRGWLSAEYAMLPRATGDRNIRESTKGKQSGRTQEIQRLIGRSLRMALDFVKLGERSITIDCDVIQADGGTRTASIIGGFVALKLAVAKLLDRGLIKESPIKSSVAAISVGVIEELGAVLDLNYYEDSRAIVDMNLVMNSQGEYIEIQGTGEERSYTRKELDNMLKLGSKGILNIINIQEEAYQKGISERSSN